MTKEEWNKHCSIIPHKTALKVKSLLEALSNKYVIYQYKHDKMNYRSNWDLFFWCNGGDDEEGRDLSYITLSMNTTRGLEEKLKGVNDVIETIREIGYNGLDIAIQYTVKFDNIKITEVAANYFERVKNTFIKCSGYDVKIKDGTMDYEGNKCYRFFKKVQELIIIIYHVNIC
ncbi:hypothetical protein [Clostridium sp.]|uniref:hypothetical protein n=1 Tax=Clostridium sp. TaxID=1506 RepID=UPI001A630E99|nr:hypothetical protein [Clostridium sp.]MBK5239778.1 hypothetical protein [Clostridium sp.]